MSPLRAVSRFCSVPGCKLPTAGGLVLNVLSHEVRARKEKTGWGNN